MLTVYGNYLAYIHYSSLDTLNQGKIELKKKEFMFMLPPKFQDEKYLPIIYEKIRQIQVDTRLKKFNLLKNILSIVELKPGWSCVMFKAKAKTP